MKMHVNEINVVIYDFFIVLIGFVEDEKKKG